MNVVLAYERLDRIAAAGAPADQSDWDWLVGSARSFLAHASTRTFHGRSRRAIERELNDRDRADLLSERVPLVEAAMAGTATPEQASRLEVVRAHLDAWEASDRVLTFLDILDGAECLLASGNPVPSDVSTLRDLYGKALDDGFEARLAQGRLARAVDDLHRVATSVSATLRTGTMPTAREISTLDVTARDVGEAVPRAIPEATTSDEVLLAATLAAYDEVRDIVHHGGGKAWEDQSETTKGMWLASMRAGTEVLLSEIEAKDVEIVRLRRLALERAPS